MQTSDTIKSSIAYIEQNIEADITADELAQMAGYSLWHYQRLFAQVTGLPLAAYLTKLRLSGALAEIAAGHKAVDAALNYGFDTYAGFYKAFVRMYGCSPKKILSLYGRGISKSEVSVMFTENQLREVLKSWDVPQDAAIHDIKIMDGAKTAETVWKIGKDYYLKTGERTMLLRNIKIARALAAQGFAAALPVQAKSGEDFLEGGPVFMLTRTMKGAPLPRADRFGDNRGDFGFKYGQSIARLHNALAAVEKDIQPYEQNLLTHVTDWALPEVQKQNTQWSMALPDSFFEEYTANFGALFDKLPKQLIHCDPNPCNILFDCGEVSGFIDFDLSECNVRLWDPCYCATGILSEWAGVPGAKEKWLDILAGILRGYGSINPLTAEEKQAVYYVICSIQMICIAYFERVDEYKELAKTSREILAFIIEQKGRIEGIF